MPSTASSNLVVHGVCVFVLVTRCGNADFKKKDGMVPRYLLIHTYSWRGYKPSHVVISLGHCHPVDWQRAANLG
ncbi:hypothetical protein BJV78DRAFT_1184588 [Lactifluus subvellereus]|nr:hypothetical protein BJV78DRAFT_1184588 [Lactifluus subvellereus]